MCDYSPRPLKGAVSTLPVVFTVVFATLPAVLTGTVTREQLENTREEASARTKAFIVPSVAQAGRASAISSSVTHTSHSTPLAGALVYLLASAPAPAADDR